MKNLMYISFVSTILLVGCAGLANNEQFNNTGDALSDSGPAITSVTTAVGGPAGSLAFLSTTLFTAAWGVWQKKRHLFVEKELDESCNKYNKLEDVAATIVQAVEAMGGVQVSESSGTVGSIVKSEVKNSLEKSNMYIEGKAIIAALKTGVDEALKEIDAKDA